ncbi:scytonemin biosynthesis PEP-CTERM protein ScyF [Funiculus sociatus GB2-A5]|uniref:Scytonemin biosynthesis PEP-CTERM protein ScyF n=1 Tax=Funiculus sociatus GB2-A5 TaxID=2933946 RepID=A0ABV0JKM2_9CYAN|nr:MULTISPECIES: scytonemin biosynthesis PEP-CTERM protein ScyF [unclassified Trichocoleus]MBD1906813.1 scytonemin biosynthesis PEP-CTERM protein ScyF [Trichocoleus sp. FACHB-832]MBD2060868.1 scytonemin biosynthesis PEP-CTERM protein ScyF [Trichocoleus sp. FACHB-6]
MGLVKNLSIAILSTGFIVAAATEAKSLTLTYERSIGSPGFGPGQLFVPQGIAVDASGNTLISNGRGLNPDGSFNPDIGNKVEVFDPQGNYIGAIGEGGKGPGQFDEPSALEIDPDTGNLYVGDVFNNRVNVYDPQGNFINSFGSFAGLIPGRAFFGPSGVTFDKAGNVYVGDFSGDKINKYTKDGELIGSIGSSGTEPGQFQGPAGLRISPVSGNFFVSDQFNNRVQVLDPEGNPILTFGKQGTGPGEFNQPIGLEVDEFENIYVADSINSRVQVFDKNGNFLTAFGSAVAAPPPQLGEPPFGNPLDLSPGKFNWTAGTSYKDDKLYVGDFFQGRVQVLNIDRTAVPEPSSVLSLAFLGIGAAATLRKRQQKSVIDLTSDRDRTAV